MFEATPYTPSDEVKIKTCPVDVDGCRRTVHRLALSVQVEECVLRSVSRSHPG